MNCHVEEGEVLAPIHVAHVVAELLLPAEVIRWCRVSVLPMSPFHTTFGTTS